MNLYHAGISPLLDKEAVAKAFPPGSVDAAFVAAETEQRAREVMAEYTGRADLAVYWLHSKLTTFRFVSNGWLDGEQVVLYSRSGDTEIAHFADILTP